MFRSPNLFVAESCRNQLAVQLWAEYNQSGGSVVFAVKNHGLGVRLHLCYGSVLVGYVVVGVLAPLFRGPVLYLCIYQLSIAPCDVIVSKEDCECFADCMLPPFLVGIDGLFGRTESHGCVYFQEIGQVISP